MEQNEFRGKKIIIAGSEGLLGKTIEEFFIGLGAVVVGLDIRKGHNLEDESCVVALMNEHQKAHVLINAFALNPQPGDASFDLYTLPLDSLDRYLKVNLLALFSVCRAFAKTCAEGASIINFSSTYGVSSPKHFIYKKGFVKHIGYTITKAGVIGMTKYLGTYLAPSVRVNAIIPGGVENSQDPEFIKNYSAMTPMKRMMKKQEILGVVRYLASQDSSYTTGSLLTVDGGWTAW